MTKLTGYKAIEYAAENGLSLNKYSDPTEDARTDLTLEEAEEIAAEDPSLIYVEANMLYNKEETVAELLPEDLEFGEFDEDFNIDGAHYQYGAWNTDGYWVLAWNTDEEFLQQLSEL